MPLSFWLGLAAVAVMLAAWIAGAAWTRARRRGSEGPAGLLAPSDPAAARGEVANSRDGIAIGMAIGNRMRQGG
jgi:hypothetical protein